VVGTSSNFSTIYKLGKLGGCVVMAGALERAIVLDEEEAPALTTPPYKRATKTIDEFHLILYSVNMDESCNCFP